MVFLLLLVACAFPALAQSAGQPFEYWPGTSYDAAIPSPKRVLGFDFGERVASHAQIVSYFEALAAAQPNRMKLYEYAKTWEGRKLVYAVIGSEANIRKLDQIKADMKRLADPRRSNQAEAQRIMASMPALVNLSYGVHGNEISSPDAAMVTAYHLLAARNSKMVDDILANVVVLIDPLQNPDGRDRFVYQYNVAEGLEPDPDPAAAEHNEPWPGGRTNHYYFDMNRDWIAATQPETKGRIKYLQEWYPLVFVDLHEMGTESTYYFAPEAIPFNPHLVPEQKTSLDWFGKTNAKYFDQFGFSYFTREVYDAFYPGYGASWPAYYGAIAMTYENGSTRGLIVRRNSDDTVITFRQTVRRHFVSSMGTLEAASQNRAQLLANFYKYRVTAIEEGAKEPTKAYILPRRGNVSNVDRLAQLLVEQGVEVQRSVGEISSGGATYPAGSYVVPLAQPAKRLIRVLLDQEVPMDAKFLEDEEKRRKRRQGSEIYDVTAWSLPLQFNVECVGLGAVPTGTMSSVKLGDSPAGSVTGQAQVAYLVPWGTNAAARFLTQALRADLRVLSTDRPFRMNGRSYGAGTLILKVKDNPASIHDTVRRLAASTGAMVESTDTGWTEEGPNFGSRWVTYLRKPRIMMAWDTPTSAGNAGHTRFVLERQFGYPVTVVRTQQMGFADLSKYDVIILPEGGYATALGGPAGQRLKTWVQSGGTLIGIGSALQYLSSQQAGLLALSQESLAREGAAPAGGRPAGGSPATSAPSGGTAAGGAAQAAPAGPVPGKFLAKDSDYEAAVEPERPMPDSLHGTLVRARVEKDLWINSGLPEHLHVLVSGRTIYAPLKADRGTNAVYYEAPDKVLASGYMWEEYKKQLAYKPFVVVAREGRGNVIGFTADPNYRAYLDGLNVLFLNAVFRGPAHTGGGRGGAEEQEQH
jgi:hypothetical protein